MEYYYEQQKIQLKKIQERMEVLPLVCRDFLIAKLSDMSIQKGTMLMYATELQIFMDYLHKYHEKFMDYKTIKDFTSEDIFQLSAEDIRAYLSYMIERKNCKSRTISRKLASISAMYTYFNMEKKTTYNPAAAVKRPKIPEHDITYMTVNEEKRFLDTVANGTGLSNHQKSFHKKLWIRDRAILGLLLDKGLRVSELVGTDITDYDFEEHSVFIRRKGGKMTHIYFSDRCEQYLLDYLKERRDIFYPTDDEKAMFLSQNGTRLTVRQIQRLVKKYAEAAVPNKASQLSPHKMRDTYAMEFYEITNDLLLLKEILGHENVQTTTLYATATKERQRDARNIQKKS